MCPSSVNEGWRKPISTRFNIYVNIPYSTLISLDSRVRCLLTEPVFMGNGCAPRPMEYVTSHIFRSLLRHRSQMCRRCCITDVWRVMGGIPNDYRWSQWVIGLPSFFIEERIQDRLRSQSQPQKSWGTAVASLVESGYLPHSLGELDYAGVGFVIRDGFGTSSGYRSWGLLGTLRSLSHHTGKCETYTHFGSA